MAYKIKKMAEGGITEDEDQETKKYLLSEFPPNLKSDLTPGSSEQVAPNVSRETIQSPQPEIPAHPSLAPVDKGNVEDTPSDMNNDERTQDSHPGHQPDDLTNYVKGQESKIDKYGPEQEKALMESIMKSQGSFGNRLARGAASLGDAIMGVAGKQSPGFLNSLENRENNQNKMALESIPALQKMNAENMGAKQSLEGKISSSPLGQAKIAFLQPLVIKLFPGKSQIEYARMLQNPDAVAQMIGIPSEIYKAEVEAKMKAQELGIQGKRADVEEKRVESEILNQQEQRRQEQEREKLTAAQETLRGSKIPFFGPSHSEKQAAAKTMADIAQGGGTQTIPAITSQVDLDKLPIGAKYTFNGQPHTKRK